MAIQFFNGNSHKNNAPITPELMEKATAAAKSYDWTDDPQEVAKIEGAANEEKAEETKDDNDGWPRKLACRKTGIIATKMYESATVVFVKGDLLLLTADEQTVRDIIT